MFASLLASRLANQILNPRGEVLASWPFEILLGSLPNLIRLGMKSFDDFKRVDLISTTGFSNQDCLIFDKTVLGRMVSKRRIRELA